MFHSSRAEQSGSCKGKKDLKSEKKKEEKKKAAWKRRRAEEWSEAAAAAAAARQHTAWAPPPSSLSLSLLSLASVPLINSWLSSVTNVSLPSSSPGEEGGVFNVQFVLWIDVCWHRLSPSAAPCVIYCTITKRASFFFFFLLLLFFTRIPPPAYYPAGEGRKKKKREKLPAGLTDWLTDTRRSTYVALMDEHGWWKETIRPP